MVIIPYIVLAAVAALFFAVSYFIICGFPMKRRKAEEMENGEEEKKGLPDLEKEEKPPRPARMQRLRRSWLRITPIRLNT